MIKFDMGKNRMNQIFTVKFMGKEFISMTIISGN